MSTPTDPTNAATSPPENPLSTIDPQTLDELFSRDPLLLSQQDLSEIVQVLREQRAKWEASTTEGAKPRGAGAKRALTPADIEDLSKALGLGPTT
jgi:hypothetical protein